MKKVLLSISIVLLLVSCGSENAAVIQNSEVTTEMHEAAPVNINGTFNVDTATSVVKWEGSKLAGAHHGVVAVSSGTIAVKDGVLSNAIVTLNLATITELDTDPELATKLVNHLKAADFFAVSKFPTATIVVTSFSENTVHADLTIKGKTKSIDFPAIVAVTEELVNVVATLIIDRTDWGIVYGSGNFFADLAKDRIISNDISFDVNIEAKR